MSFLLEVSIERGRDNRGSGRSGRGRGGTGSNRGGGGGRGANYPRNQHHQQGQSQSGGGSGRGVGRGWVPTKTGDQQRGNRPGQRGQGGGAYRPHQHGGQGVGPTRVESSVVGGGGGAAGGRGVWTGRPWGPTFVPGQSQPRSLPAPVIPNIQSLEISEQKPRSTLLDALQEISLLAAKVLVTKLISSLKPNV